MPETIVAKLALTIAQGLLVLTTVVVIGSVMYAAYRVATTLKDLIMQVLKERAKEKEQFSKEEKTPIKENREKEKTGERIHHSPEPNLKTICAQSSAHKQTPLKKTEPIIPTKQSSVRDR